MSKKIISDIRRLESSIRKQKQKLAALRRRAPKEAVEDHVLIDSYGKPIVFSDLFDSRNELILVHNMGTQCTSCTLWADGFNGQLRHLEKRAAFVVESPEEPAVQRQFAADRGWGFRMVSSKGSPFRKAMGYETPDGFPWPGISCFTRDGKGRIFRVSHTPLGPGDNYCTFWDLLDLLPTPHSKFYSEVDYYYSKKR
jgi:predicted dithiol-disulfide oxidoreductase (DUF899 family)